MSTYVGIICILYRLYLQKWKLYVTNLFKRQNLRTVYLLLLLIPVSLSLSLSLCLPLCVCRVTISRIIAQHVYMCVCLCLYNLHRKLANFRCCWMEACMCKHTEWTREERRREFNQNVYYMTHTAPLAVYFLWGFLYIAHI